MADTYKILAQKQSVDINPSGNGFVDNWDITYRVTSGAANGTVATVVVPDSDHNEKYVDQAIRDKIATLHGIGQLGMNPVA